MFPEAKYQRCTVHFYRNVFSVVPKSKAKKVESGIEETLTYCDFPTEHWNKIRTNNVIRATIQGNPTQNKGGRSLSGREFCIDVGVCPAASCSRNTVGLQKVHEYEASGSYTSRPDDRLIAASPQLVKGVTSC